VHPSETALNGLEHVIEIDRIPYYSTLDVLTAAGISRQTLWRWRQEGKVPRGNRFRNGQVLFSEAEYRAVLEFANRVEPQLIPTHRLQLGFFK
jgi:predicted DNA-binding transcriptional regulator AlpA